MITVNEDRLINNIKELGYIGENEVHGIDRWFGSDKDLEAREWIKSYWTKNLKGVLHIDAIANLWMKEETPNYKKPIVIGSHHDAVPCGGKYDGAMGVLIATEVKQTLQEKQYSLKHPLYLLSFTGEEPNPFNVSTLGSKVLSGRLKQQDLEQLKNRENQMSMTEAVKKAGGDITLAHTARINKNEIGAFIECHIEQGHRLEDMGLSVAAVTAITGIYREEIRLTGVANHAGTTPMKERQDAFLAAAEVGLALEKEAGSYINGEVVATVGCFQMLPNEASIIPETVTLTIDIRTCENRFVKELLKKFTKRIDVIAEGRKVAIERKIILDQKSMPMDCMVMDAITTGIIKSGSPKVLLNSMAGHDAANMARICPSGMIFVQSVNGKSHCKEEYTKPEDIIKGANAMLQSVLYLDEIME